MAAADGATNPFSMPSEAEFFWLHNVEQSKTDTNRASNKELQIWEKTTASSNCNATRFLSDKDMPMNPLSDKIQKKLSAAKGKVMEEERPDSTFLTTIASKPAIGLVEPLKKNEKEIRNYVKKKREVFLAHMACDVKRAEIGRLEDKARMKEEALANSWQVLEEDTRKFEEYLQNKIELASKTTKQAEDHAKRKLEKNQKIKQMKTQIAGVMSEISKHREVREECSRYKNFLDKLTPSEWKDEQAELKKARKAKRRERWIQEKAGPALASLVTEERRIEEAASDEAMQHQTTGRGGRARAPRPQDEEEQAQKERERQKILKKIQKKKEEELKKAAALYEEISSEEEYELYFKEPRQLMDTLTELEEKNLFLIQSSQETEQALDDLQHTFGNTKSEMQNKVQRLRDNIRQLELSAAQERRRRDSLRASHAEKAGTASQEAKLQDLQEKVNTVYVRCGLSMDHGPDTLQMLAAIESKIEDLIQGLDEAFHQDQELVMGLEKKKEKARRERMRDKRLQDQSEKQEMRLQNSLQRSQAPVFRKAGKQVMYRSPPLRQERRVVKDTGDDEAHARDHRVFGMYIDRRDGLPKTEVPVPEDPRARPPVRSTSVPNRSPAPGAIQASSGASSAAVADTALAAAATTTGPIAAAADANATGTVAVSSEPLAGAA